MSIALALVRAAHPLPGLAVTVLTALLAASMGVSAQTTMVLVVAVLSGQLVVGWTNDVRDRERDRRVGRRDKPLATGELSVGLVRSAIGVSAVACVVASLLCGPGAGLLHLTLGVGAGLAYNFSLKSTGLSWLPYTLAFGSLPAVVSLSRDPSALPPLWMIAVGALLGFAAHLLNAMPDLADDATTGVRGFPHRLAPTTVPTVAALTLVAASVVAVFGSRTPPTAGQWILLSAVLVLAVAVTRTTGKRPFYAAIVIAGINVVMLLIG
ncbi:UbiA family prenyltransferase [Rhodococcus sp. IEGM 1408]|uniref:UbiA family prenyltransferase n=1 Tax=Rhodococcus sp. IEGM 1408 TaxID=3082220 RepID=UPI002953A7E7|nr:UbiA family prenyltransferase [Rhodococcus sp. IEGM 1408]MDV8003062.1 UbiA family prenyltransferase [Rhodococcus sp. IEGM 1408]